MNKQLSISDQLYREVEQAADKNKMPVNEWVRQVLHSAVMGAKAELSADEQSAGQDGVINKLELLRMAIRRNARPDAVLTAEDQDWLNTLSGCISLGMTDEEIEQDRYQYLMRKHG